MRAEHDEPDLGRRADEARLLPPGGQQHAAGHGLIHPDRDVVLLRAAQIETPHQLRALAKHAQPQLEAGAQQAAHVAAAGEMPQVLVQTVVDVERQARLARAPAAGEQHLPRHGFRPPRTRQQIPQPAHGRPLP